MNPELTNSLTQTSQLPSSIRSTIPVQISDDSGNSCLDFISSDESLDRYDEIISASGWKLDNYLRNPVFQNAHQYGDILFTLGRALITEIRVGTTSPAPRALSRGTSSPYLFQRIQFACDINPMAKIAYGLYKGKFLNAVSVGFVPLRWEDGSSESSSSSSSSSSSFRRRYLEQELLEVSAVGIPANPNALALGLKSGAIQKSDLRDLSELIQLTLSHPHPASSIQHPVSSIQHSESSIQNPVAPSTQLLHFAKQLHSILRS